MTHLGVWGYFLWGWGGGQLLDKAPADTSTSRTEAGVHLGSTQRFYVCVSVRVGGTRQHKEDGEVEEVTKSCSGSLTAGLQILHLHSALPALLTDALMKDKTELSGEHGRTHTHTHSHTLTLTQERQKD